MAEFDFYVNTLPLRPLHATLDPVNRRLQLPAHVACHPLALASRALIARRGAQYFSFGCVGIEELLQDTSPENTSPVDLEPRALARRIAALEKRWDEPDVTNTLLDEATLVGYDGKTLQEVRPRRINVGKFSADPGYDFYYPVREDICAQVHDTSKQGLVRVRFI
jgi:hypothetical protein